MRALMFPRLLLLLLRGVPSMCILLLLIHPSGGLHRHRYLFRSSSSYLDRLRLVHRLLEPLKSTRRVLTPRGNWLGCLVRVQVVHFVSEIYICHVIRFPVLSRFPVPKSCFFFVFFLFFTSISHTHLFGIRNLNHESWFHDSKVLIVTGACIVCLIDICFNFCSDSIFFFFLLRFFLVGLHSF